VPVFCDASREGIGICMPGGGGGTGGGGSCPPVMMICRSCADAAPAVSDKPAATRTANARDINTSLWSLDAF